MPSTKQYTSIGGQAVIEGVMMRSPHFVAVAVRRPDQSITVRSERHQSISKKYPILGKPVLRGVVTLVESMILGIEALSFSANAAADSEDEGEELSAMAITLSIASAFLLGMGLFVGLPHLLTALLGSSERFGFTANSPIFHLVDGLIKMAILLAYVYGIAMMEDIRRVFQYHGAEHKSIYAFEAGETLSVANAQKHTTLHPRCGTSFLLFMVVISILTFSVVFPLFGLTHFSENPILNHLLMIFIKIGLMLPVAGLAYEFIKMCAYRMNNPIYRALIWPGLVLQNLTTKTPESDQLEVALASLKQVLKLEKDLSEGKSIPEGKTESIIHGIGEIQEVQAKVQEFPEI